MKQQSYFMSKEGLTLLFVSIACLIYFLVVPSEDAAIKRARATVQVKPVTLETEKDVFTEKEASSAATPTKAASGFCINLPVLMYHHIQPKAIAETEGHAQLTVSPEMFESHVVELQNKGYRIISIQEAVNALVSKTNPGKAAVITIDDGYKDNFTYALPIAQKYHAPITFFIAPGLLENPGYMSWEDLKTAKNSGLISFFNHTWSHFSLPAGNIDEGREEITTAEKMLEEKLGSSQNIFAYPYGSYDNRSVDILENEGYTAAFTTEISTTLCDSHMLALPRVRIGEAPLSYFGL